MKTYVALLRGVNVGGKHKLPMKELCTFFGSAGCTDVRSYIQSGNVIFRAAPAVAKAIPALIASQIEKAFGHKPPVILRTGEDMIEVTNNNPFLKKGAAFLKKDTNGEMLHVMFLASEPSAAAVNALDPNRSPPDTFIVQGREIYLCLPNGVADSKLTNAYFDSKLVTVSTGRNWRTVNKVLEIMRD